MKFLPIYKDVYNLHQNKYRFYIYKGGRGGGKSHHIALALLNQAQNRAVRILCTREIQNSIKDSVHKLLKDYITVLKLYGFSITDNSIKHKDGSEFIFKGLNDINDSSAQSIKSLEGVDIAWIEEAQTISKRSLDVLIPTIRKANSCLIFSFNPLTTNDPINELVVKPRPSTLIKHINYTDNPYLDKAQQEEAEHCRANKPEDYEHIWLGKPKDMSASSVTKYFTNDNIKNLKYLPDADLYLSCDFNTSAPMSWVIAHKDENKVYFIDEIVLENADTREAAEEFIKRYGNHKGIITICGDASGDYLQAGSKRSNYTVLETLLTQAKLKWRKKIRPKNPEIIHRVEAWNNRILTTYGERCLFVSPKCKWLLWNIYNLTWKEGTEGKFNLPTSTQIRNNPELNFLGHIFDAASYLVEIHWQVVNHKMGKILTKQNFREGSGWEVL